MNNEIILIAPTLLGVISSIILAVGMINILRNRYTFSRKK